MVAHHPNVWIEVFLLHDVKPIDRFTFIHRRYHPHLWVKLDKQDIFISKSSGYFHNGGFLGFFPHSAETVSVMEGNPHTGEGILDCCTFVVIPAASGDSHAVGITIPPSIPYPDYATASIAVIRPETPDINYVIPIRIV
jgi:hypothetical protein